MEPVGGRVAAAQPGLYSVYDQADVLASGRSCAVAAEVEGLAAGGGPEDQGACELELACEKLDRVLTGSAYTANESL